MKKLFISYLLLCLWLPLAQAQQNYFESEVQQLEARDASLGYQAPLLFIGSSTIRMWTNVESVFAQFEAINRGFGGSQVSDLLYFKERLIFPHSARGMVLYSGDNDLASNKTPERVAEDFRQLISAVREVRHYPIFLFGVKQSPARAHKRQEIAKLNQLLATMSEEFPDLVYLDFNSRLAGSNGLPDERHFRNDRLHFRPSAYHIMENMLRDAFVQIALRSDR